LEKHQLEMPEATYPLELVYCPVCALVQITETVSPEVLFRDYLYESSYSDAFVHHGQLVATSLISSRSLNSDDLVIEIGSNDGYLLQHYLNAGVQVLGIEPANRIAEIARTKRQVQTLAEFFSLDLATRLASEGSTASVIHANNVLAHVPDLNGVVAGIKVLLATDGVARIEAPYVYDMVEHVEFDTIYHEHLCYFSLTSLQALFNRHGLEIVHADHIPFHGGSLQITVAHQGAMVPSDAFRSFLQQEQDAGVHRIEFYQAFASRVENLKTKLVRVLSDLKRDRKTIVAYGASAKGSTLCNYFNLGADTLEYIVDRNIHKQGRFAPGNHLPIYSPDRLIQDRPDYVLLLTWNFAEEIMTQQSAYRRLGGRFILPIPDVRIIEDAV